MSHMACPFIVSLAVLLREQEFTTATAVLGNLAKNFNINFSACVKFHVENEWEISLMCEIDV